MTMHDHLHPDDERLAAFAGADPEATGDRALSGHLEECARCREVVGELRMLRTALGGLPDLVPSRPLRLLPPAPEAQPGWARRASGFIRGAFAPALTAGAALALVGMVGTAGTLFQGMASAPAAQVNNVAQTPEADGAEGGGFGAANDAVATPRAATPESYAPGKGATHELRDYTAFERSLGEEPSTAEAPTDGSRDEGDDDGEDVAEFADGPGSDDGGSPWPIVLVAGVGLIGLALILRFAVVPRAG